MRRGPSPRLAGSAAAAVVFQGTGLRRLDGRGRRGPQARLTALCFAPMQPVSPAPLPVVLSPEPSAAAAPRGWPSWDEVLTIRRHEPAAGGERPQGPSWDELLGSR